MTMVVCQSGRRASLVKLWTTDERLLDLPGYADYSCRRIASAKLLSEHRELPAQSLLVYGIS